MEYKAKTLGNIWAHQTLEDLCNDSASSLVNQDFTEMGHREIDHKFCIENDYLYHQVGLDCDNKVSPYQVQADKAFDLGYYPEAIRNLNQAIDIEPNNSTLCLERGASQFHMGQYKQALQDFETFTTHSSPIPEQNPLFISEFSVGFTKGLPQGVYESGKGIMTFLSDFVMHPVHTSTQVVQSLSTLAELVREEEWEMIGKAMAPELCELVKEWDILPSNKKGELAGYAIGKHGTDILAPGTIAKVASKSAKTAKKLATVCKNIKLAEQTLVLETASEIANLTKSKEIIRSAQSASLLNERLGFSAEELSQLKQIVKLKTGSCAETVKEAQNLNKLQNIIKMIDEYLGGKGKIIINSDGDMILIRGDRKIRFDVKDPHGDKPHFHLEKKNAKGKWIDAGSEHRYYFDEN